MGVIIFLCLFLVYLVFLVITSSLVDSTLKISSRKTIPFNKLVLPSTLVLLTWITFVYMYYITLDKLGVNLGTYLINSFLNIPNPATNMTLIFGVLGLYILVAIVLQSFYVYLINFNLSKPFVIAYNKTKEFIIKNLLKIEKFKTWYNKIDKKDNEDSNENEKEVIKLDLLTCFFSSILTFILIVAFILVLIFIANILSNKILSILINK